MEDDTCSNCDRLAREAGVLHLDLGAKNARIQELEEKLKAFGELGAQEAFDKLKSLTSALADAKRDLIDITNGAIRIREGEAVVGIEASFIERIAREALKRIGSVR